MNSKILSLISIVLLFLTGCGGGGSGNDEAAVALAKGVEGNWQRECTFVPNLNNSNTTDVVISSSQLIRTFAEYPTANCTGVPGYLEVSTYDLSATGSSSNAFCEFVYIDTVLTGVSVNGVVLTDQEAAAYTREFGKTNYDIACNVDNQLYFGLEDAEHDSESEDGRPVEIDTQVDAVLIQAFYNNIEGDWRRSCVYDEQFDYSYEATITFTPTKMYRGQKEYDNSDCSDVPVFEEMLEYDLSIAGTHETSFCTADKIDISIKKITINGVLLTDEASADWTREWGKTKYDIICKVANKLYLGDLRDGNYVPYVETGRPTQINSEAPPLADIRE